MLGVTAPHRKKDYARGLVWPLAGQGADPAVVADPFGPRTFSGHTNGYDWHRGVDVGVSANGGQVVATPAGGVVTRVNKTFETFGLSLGRLSEVDPDGLVAPSVLFGDVTLSFTTVPSVSSADFLGSAKLVHSELVRLTDDCEVRAVIQPSNLTTEGALGIFLWDQENDEYAALDFCLGTDTLTSHAVDSAGADVTDGATSASGAASVFVLSLVYDQSAGTVTFRWRYDSSSWTTHATWSSVSWTSQRPVFSFGFYFRKTSTSAGSDTGFHLLSAIGCAHPDTIGRFGNWVVVNNPKTSQRWCLMHMGEVDVSCGDKLEPGDTVGRVGNTGFDDTSGEIQQNHLHVELIPQVGNAYDNDDPINPLGVGLLPRADATSNVAVTVTEEDDPNSDASFKLLLEVDRADQDFDVNVVQLVGDSATRTVNFNTRAGLDPADHDNPDYDGVYLEPQAFDEDDDTWTLAVYFEKAVVGTSLVSAQVLDTEGNVLWSSS